MMGPFPEAMLKPVRGLVEGTTLPVRGSFRVRPPTPMGISSPGQKTGTSSSRNS